MKIVTIVGARPQFIKAATVSRAITTHNSKLSDQRCMINEIIVHTGQHFDENMSEVFFREMQIPSPNYYLEINSLNHGAMTGRMLEKIEEILMKEKPEYVMVYGDTNSTLAGALAARKLNIRVVHVEAGLRSFNMRMPEEVNRILTDHISDILCCPTETAVQNLMNEGYKLSSDQGYKINSPIVKNTGDVMQDAALFYSKHSAAKSNVVERLGLEQKEFVLCTVHRAENTDDTERLTNIFTTLQEISHEITVVLPLHPRTQKILNNLHLDLLPAMNDLSTNVGTNNLVLVPPVSYFDMIELLKHTKFVMTDSGGLQKEAFFFQKQCITLRDETEWVELVELGVNTLVGADPSAILGAQTSMNYRPTEFNKNIYGGGIASMNIVDLFCSN